MIKFDHFEVSREEKYEKSEEYGIVFKLSLEVFFLP